MKMLAVINDHWSSKGGIAQAARDAVAAFSSHKEISEVVVVCRSKPPKARSDFLPNGVRLISGEGVLPLFIIKVLFISLCVRPQLIYCGHAFLAPLIRVAGFISGARTICHTHGLELRGKLSVIRHFSLAGMSHFMCVSRDTADLLVVRVGIERSKISLVHNTLSELFRPISQKEARCALDIPLDAKVVVTVARLDGSQKHKGHELVMSCISDFVRDMPNLLYIIVGEGDDAPRLQALAHHLGIEKRVTFSGYVPTEQLPVIYSAADVYAMPSTGDGFGIAFIEAMACGTPAIGLDAGGAADALIDGVLGCATTVDDFPRHFYDLLMHTQQNRVELNESVTKRFGRKAFNEKIGLMLERV